MSHRDFRAKASVEPTLNVDLLRRAMDRLLNGVDFDDVRFRDDCRWVPRSLVAAALLWAWSDEATLVERFQTAVRIACRIEGRQDDSRGSYQAFVKLLVRWTGLLAAALKASLRRRMSRLKRGWTIDGGLLFAVDGTRIELPRTRRNEEAFSATRRRLGRTKKKRRKKRNVAGTKKAKAPQLWLTTLFHVGSGLPWDWRIGPADASERTHFREMLDSLPENATVAADAGYVGYDLVAAVLASGRGLILRVGGNAKLLRKLGCVRESAGTVYLWPDKIAKKRLPPLVLRLVETHDGKRSIHLLASAPAYGVARAPLHAGLSDRRVLELYRRRWGVELFYRGLKRTYRKRKLRSASPGPALVEMEWSLLGFWTMGLHAIETLEANGDDPRRLSCAKLLRAFRRTLRDWRCEVEPRRTLGARLRRALIDDYARGDKSSRDWPRKKQERPPGPPVILDASPTQRLAARTLFAIT